MNISDRIEMIRFRWGGFEENTRRDVLIPRAFPSVLIEPDYFRVWGTDHSAWDGNVDFGPMATKGARFTFLKAMEGTVATKYYVENTLRAKAAGLLVAPYHWLHQNAKVNCKLQAQKVWERTKAYVTKLPLMVDFEWTKYLGAWANPTYTDLDIFVTEFTRISGIKPLLYSAAGFMNTYGKIPDWLLRKFSGIVIASYGTINPIMPLGLTEYTFHQFASTGDAEIISPNDAGKKEVDLINFKGTAQAFDMRYGIISPEPQPAPEPGGAMKGVVKTGYTLKIRDGAGNDTGKKLFAGDTVYGPVINGRIYFFRVYRANGTIEEQAGNAAVRDATTEWMTITEEAEPTPNPTPIPSPLPVLQVTVSGEGYESVIVELRPR